MGMEQQVLAANDEFYDAFNRQDLDRMSQLWWRDPAAICIHPGWAVLRGFGPILNSWSEIFEHTDHMEIKLSDVTVLVSEDLAWVGCQENLFSINMSGVQTSRVYATNLFRRVGGQWKMALHHAAAVPSPESGSASTN